MQTKLGEKVNILLDRLSNVVYGETNLKQQKNDKSVVKVSQPLSGMNHQASRADHRGSPSQQYPSSLGDMAQAQTLAQTGANSTPNFNAMYAGPNTPLVGAATPGEPMSDMMNEPAAANSVLGGHGFGTLF